MLGGGVEVWVGLLFLLKSPGQFISCLFWITNLSAILLLHSPPHFSVVFSGNGVHSLASSFFLVFPSTVFYATEISLGSNCYSRSALLSWLRLGSGGTCLYVFFHPTRPKYREIKMGGGGGRVSWFLIEVYSVGVRANCFSWSKRPTYCLYP